MAMFKFANCKRLPEGIHMVVSTNGGYSWMVDFMEKPWKTWMMTGGTPNYDSGNPHTHMLHGAGIFTGSFTPKKSPKKM